jgi:hypothetical protein
VEICTLKLPTQKRATFHSPAGSQALRGIIRAARKRIAKRETQQVASLLFLTVFGSFPEAFDRSGAVSGGLKTRE